jgi:hypothetical protein
VGADGSLASGITSLYYLFKAIEILNEYGAIGWIERYDGKLVEL